MFSFPNSEVNILRELDHAHIVRYHDRIIDRQRRRIYIVMEHCPGGDLAALIKRATRSAFSAALTGASAVGPVAGLPEAFVWRVLAHVAQALHACHSRPQGAVLHRDLKPGNILLDAEGRAKLCDFGLARVLAQAGDCARTHVGTPYYMSPEQCLGTGYGAKSDIWSLGCLVYELCALEPPFKALTHYTLSAKIQRGRFAPLPPAYSPELGAVVAAMLRVEAAARPAVADILTVPAVAAIVRGDAAPRPAAPATTPAAAAEDAQAQALQTQARELIAQVQRRERAVATKELELQHREQDVARRELELARKELEWARRTAEADAREAALEKRLRALAAAVPASAPEAEVDVPE
jgi:NIMA (never in mitosis gene a)-related kinase